MAMERQEYPAMLVGRTQCRRLHLLDVGVTMLTFCLAADPAAAGGRYS